MSQDNPVADRLLAEARKKTARQKSPALGKIALVIGIIALVASPVSIVGWVGGLAAIGVGIAAVRNPDTAKLAKIAMGLGFAAILVGVFFFTLNIA
ncbi:hypothetical protein LWC35_13880 [Pseudonocardia kujensis]|uniref:hypothetical protein n=1 Tax=Pseudonocardia kujensis TaxID=1128675 RepID=UPI001E37F753|nr:hypothetical protein [Pseudonocardia kujensis]MCE0763993.1 hypothetical protein [Pseudonocardia kujensis]